MTRAHTLRELSALSNSPRSGVGIILRPSAHEHVIDALGLGASVELKRKVLRANPNGNNCPRGLIIICRHIVHMHGVNCLWVYRAAL